MNELLQLSASEISIKLQNKNISSYELTKLYFEHIFKLNKKINSILYINYKAGLEQAAIIDKKRINGEKLDIFAGIPILIKDAFTTYDMPTTCASKMLDNWQSPYDATVVSKLRERGLIFLGKANMDEFAMGSTNCNSAYGNVRNPLNINCVPGGSSGGSFAAISSFQAPLALGSDTGGSVRQPAAYTGCIGIKPTYGAISRYGLVAFASSFDTVGLCTRSVEDAVQLYNICNGKDKLDSTSVDTDDVDSLYNNSNLRIGIIKEFVDSSLPFNDNALELFNNTCNELDKLYKVDIVSCPSFLYALSTYHIISTAEASSNLARYDGMIYGKRSSSGNKDVASIIKATRSDNFGKEVKRRIMLGSFNLLHNHSAEYYKHACNVRDIIINDFKNAFSKYDVLISPTTLSNAIKFGTEIDYQSDIFTTPANLARVPAGSMPCGITDNNLPVGIQVIAPYKHDCIMYNVMSCINKLNSCNNKQYINLMVNATNKLYEDING